MILYIFSSTWTLEEYLNHKSLCFSAGLQKQSLHYDGCNARVSEIKSLCQGLINHDEPIWDYHLEVSSKPHEYKVRSFSFFALRWNSIHLQSNNWDNISVY